MLEAFGIIAVGVLLVGAAAVLLLQYRDALFQDPRTIMTLEVVLQVLRLGGPGYLAMLCILGGVWLLGVGIFMFVAEAVRHFGGL